MHGNASDAVLFLIGGRELVPIRGDAYPYTAG